MLVDIVRKHFNSRLQHCQGSFHQDICDAAVYGSLHRGLESYIGYPFPLSEDLVYSLREIRFVISELKVTTAPAATDTQSMSASPAMGDHSACNPKPRLLSQCDSVIRELGDGLADEQVRHLKSQAAKCGSDRW